MAFIALIAFIVVPIVEIAVFIQVGEQIGVWSTIGVVVLTAIIGTAMLRQQGLSVLFRIQENLQANRIPVQELFDGVCLVIAGALLLTPGFVTDTVGFLLFVPPYRHWLAGEIRRQGRQTPTIRSTKVRPGRMTSHPMIPAERINPFLHRRGIPSGDCARHKKRCAVVDTGKTWYQKPAIA